VRTLTRTPTHRADSAVHLESLGYATLKGALSPDRVADLSGAVDDVWRRHRVEPAAPGAAPLHLLAFLREDPQFLDLVDHRSVLQLITKVLGPNIFMYHCHLDVHPPETSGRSRWMWHQDGGVQNRDLETDPRPRLSLKVAYFLTDMTEPDRGNFVVLPGSHVRNAIARPVDDDNSLPDAVPILASPGDAVVFDRRLWHMRAPNTSMRTRKALFYAYTFRWIRTRDELGLDPTLAAQLTPAQRQLVGLDGADPIDLWMPDQQELPVRALDDESAF